MQNLWDDEEAARYASAADNPELGLRVYTSRLLGSNPGLVLHGGGNTSVKSSVTNLFGEQEQILYVKGSGWDLATILAEGFSPARLDVLARLAELPAMTDTAMARELKASMIDPGAPSPSVEAILHAIIPAKFVDHTHTDAVVGISNTPDGEQRIRDLYGDRVLVLPYVMPGFVLAKQVYEMTRETDWSSLAGIMLMHHGLFTFGDDARTSYDNMISLVSEAEALLLAQGALEVARVPYQPEAEDFIALASMRRAVGEAAGRPMLARWQHDEEAVGYASLPSIHAIGTRGPLTPDHTLHTKRVPAIVDGEPGAGIERFRDDYLAYFERHRRPEHVCLDPAPRYAVWRDKGIVVFGDNPARLNIVSDIVDHTIAAVQWGEALGGWTALGEAEIFELEYWELEQAKLKRMPAPATLTGKVAVVTGGASGIGAACVEAFRGRGAVVVALDIDPSITGLAGADVHGIHCDVLDAQAVRDALQEAAGHFGGVDILVSNAGNFPKSEPIDSLDEQNLRASLALNFESHATLVRACLPFLKRGFDPAVLLVASKNVPAPGPGAAAYSAAKAALTQFGRVAALELGEHGIRVNTVHPNAVFDTALWSQETIASRAAAYGVTPEAYRRNNVLRTEVSSADVARLLVEIAGPAFAKTTGAQVPVDGGNERVI